MYDLLFLLSDGDNCIWDNCFGDGDDDDNDMSFNCLFVDVFIGKIGVDLERSNTFIGLTSGEMVFTTKSCWLFVFLLYVIVGGCI